MSRPTIAVRGYVHDLDEEMRSADLQLMLNNVAPYPTAFTRQMMAWSIGQE